MPTQRLYRAASAITCLLLLATRPANCAEPQPLPQQLVDLGWISLFDGETLFGWQPTGEAKWEVVDGEIRIDGSKPGFLMTTTQWANYELDFEFRAPANTNSGVFVRTSLDPKDPARDCCEWNIAPADNPFPTGSLVARQKADLPAEQAPKADMWHSVALILAPGGMMAVIDGQRTVRYAFDKSAPQIGYIGLQSREGAVAFRNIRLLPMGLEPLLNGKDLKGWSTERAEKSKFEVTNQGELHLTNGPGQIDSTADFKNFVLQAECKVNGDGLNSGIFFRTLREGRWTGYESQINNKFKDGDRTKPADFGTGGIYRRQPARRVIADDHQWFTNTIVADGPHMAVWVNGYQVSDWTDPRPPKDSPREGRRDGGGAIAIQGHDATTDFLFRNIRAVELPR
jgi:hypothetical protein